MQIELKQIAIREIVKGYINEQEEGVYGYNGQLNIRPKYQREFIYSPEKQCMVIDTIMRGLPLNIMYWAENNDNTFEVLDGQQRTISFCEYITGNFSIVKEGIDQSFHNLTDDEQNQILDYKVMVYVVKGSDKERLDWFRTINIAGEKLTDQELLNINYTGTWLSDAKKNFSKTNCVAYLISNKYVKGVAIRQELLEIALKWICYEKGIKNISTYMAEHQHDVNANELYTYFKNVIDWVKLTFPTERKEMKGIDWGKLYKEYVKNMYDTKELEKKISSLMADEDVTNKKGIYEYVLSNCTNEKVLNIRLFSERDKRTAYEKQKGFCAICGEHHEIDEMQADHIVEWSKGGKTSLDNLQMVCHKCHKNLTRTLF